ncbi:hypothetical protein EPUS_07071 [Endocarpon pusillum Z07020]|uniref:Uncharacterized protein n=1 Tax=Endocarpon pusillum (strain Z07020 / HMAS-L-300199) TaxID=1263415 RepID=U1I2Y6_ENDPU|nr:uncharacterized protein EPUS_07071 [Endocarpon pusillum Z07020]ERF76364.1 hypothetical protein EPUS_07071 [Endocarpon pusillum Z07020]
MADDWEQPDGSNKRVYEQFLEGDEMRDLFNMPQPTEKPHHEVPAEVGESDSLDMKFYEYFALLDDPAVREIFESLSPSEISHQINDCPPAQGIPQAERDANLGKSVPYTQTWFDPSPNPQEQLYLQNPQGTLLDDFFQSTPAPQGAINFDSCFAGRGKLIPSAEVMADLQPDVMEVDDPFSLPELHGSPSLDYEHDIMAAAQQLIATKEQPAQASQPPKKEGRRRRRIGKIKQIPGFPSSSEPLPSNLSLEEMCRSWPNHLHGVSLEPFVEAGWNGRMVWDHMPEAAKDGSKRQAWNKMVKRLTRTKQQMELEGRGPVGAGLTPEAMWKNLVGETSGDAAQQYVAVNAHNGSLTTLHNPQHAEALQDITSYQNNQPKPENPFEAMRCAFRAELDEQHATIALLLAQQRADWLLISFDEVTSRITQTWMEHAHEHEARFIRENWIDDEDIPFDPVSRVDMLKRLGELICRLLLASNPPRPATNEQEEEAFRQSHYLRVLGEELSILKGWTSAWKWQVEQFNADSYFGIVDGAAEQSGGGSQEQNEQLLEETPSFQSAFSAFDPNTSATEAGVLSHGEQTSIPQTFLDQSWAQDTWLSSDAPTPTFQTFLDQLQTQVTADPSLNRVNDPPSTKKAKGGRRKLRMFPHAPSKDVILSQQDLADLDHIMANFPEHLALPHVMVRYLCPPGTRQGCHDGAYFTNDMVEKLFHHHNAKHGSDLDHPDRFKGIHDWVMTQKDAARKYRRGGLPRRPKLANSSAGGRQEDSQNDGVYGDQIREERFDVDPALVGQHQQSNDNFMPAAQFTSQPIRFEAELAQLPGVSAEQEAPEQETQEHLDDQAFFDELAMLLEPRSFG